MAELYSVVMPSYNQAQFIERSIRSVLEQEYESIELIVADGGSDDGTVALLERLADEFPGLRWFSEPDNGPANAINKALDRVRGEFVGWVNSDDLYTPGALKRAAEALRAHPDWLVCYGQGEFIDALDTVTGTYPTRPPEAGLSGFAAGCYICQPTMAFRTPLLALIGKMDESQKTSFDYEFWLRVFSEIPDRIGFIDAVQAQSRLHEDCITVNLRRTVAVEGLALTRRYLGEGAPHWITTYLEEIRPEFDDAQFDRHARELFAQVAADLDPDQMNELRDATLAVGKGDS